VWVRISRGTTLEEGGGVGKGKGGRKKGGASGGLGPRMVEQAPATLEGKNVRNESLGGKLEVASMEK